MSFINWGEETPEQKRIRNKFEEEQSLFEQAVRMSRTTGSMSGAAASGSGKLPNKPMISASFIPLNNNGSYIQVGFNNSNSEEFKLVIDWGDGTEEEYLVTDDWIYPEHYFSDDSEKFVTFTSKRFDLVTEIGLAWTNLTSITGLNLLSNVTSLDISGCAITDFDETFTWPTRLTELTMNNNWQIASFSPVNPLPNTVSQIAIQNCGNLTVFNPSNTSFPNLYYLTISSTALSNFTASVQMPQLSYLQLGSNAIHDFTGDLSLCPALQNLNLRANSMVTFNPSQPLPPVLDTLDLDQNQLTSFNPTHALPNSLRYLFLGDNRLTSFSPSQSLPGNLYWVELYGNRITEFNPTYTLSSSLRVLRLQGNLLTTADQVLSKIQDGIEELNLSNNRITSFTPENRLPNGLSFLELGNNQITAFAPIYGLPSSLRSLFLYNNQLTSCATNFPNLRQFNISGNNQLTNLDISTGFGDNLIQFFSVYTKLSVSNVNAILNRLGLVAYGGMPGQLIISTQWQNPLAPPSGSGLNSKTLLQSRGYTVYTD